jgi:hypothetical protein
MRLTFPEHVIDQISEYKFNHRAPLRGVLESTFVCRMGARFALRAPNCDALTTPGGVSGVHIGGHAVPVMQGTLNL